MKLEIVEGQESVSVCKNRSAGIEVVAYYGRNQLLLSIDNRPQLKVRS